MKIANSIVLKKYETDNYTKLENNVYCNAETNKYYITLYCILNEGEDTQYPLEDMLDKYSLNCTDHFENCIINSKNVFIFELEGNKEDILNVASLIGKDFS